MDLIDFILIYTFVFLFGLCIGSFLNCVIYRLENKKSLSGRSFCPRCKHALSWQDLFPIFSFLFLQGKCRYCKAKISLQYPLLEIGTGILFVLMFWGLGFDWKLEFGIWGLINLCFWFYIASVLIVIFVYDLKHYIIPDKILLPAIFITFIFRIIENGNLNLLNYIFAVLIGAGFFFAIWFFSGGKWMGFGDVKLAVLMGLLLGVKNILVALFLAFFFGAIIGIILMIFRKKGIKSEIPFAPFLIIGTFISIIWSNQLIQWYFHIFLI